MGRRIAIIAYEFPVVSETFIVDHVVGIARRGWSPVLICDALHRDGVAAAEARCGLSLETYRPAPRRGAPHRTPARLAWLAAAAARSPRLLSTRHGRAALVRAGGLVDVLREARADVVHAHFGPNGVAAALALGGRTPLVVDFHGFDLTAFPRAAGWGLYRETLRGAALVVHSEFAAKAVATGLGVPVQRVTLGADPDLFHGGVRGERWSAPLRLLVVGRLVPEKGQAIAIRALDLLRRGSSPMDARLCIVGGGPQREKLERLVRELRLEGAVEFTGPQPHAAVADEMASADALLIPSIVGPDGEREAFGRVAVEGLAAGLPVVASAVGGLPEVVGEAGYLFTPGDPEALARCVRDVLAQQTPERCAATSRTRATAFSLERMWDEYEAVTSRAAHG